MFNITNYADHPSNPLYLVYKFKTIEESKTFQELLAESSLFYEADEAENVYGALYVVAVKNKDESLATKLNYLAIGKYRKPIVNNIVVRTIIYAITVVILGFALVGFYLSS
jgi:hypothetical protein